MTSMPSFERVNAHLSAIYAAIGELGLRLEDYIDRDKGVRYRIVRGPQGCTEVIREDCGLEDVRRYVLDQRLSKPQSEHSLQ